MALTTRYFNLLYAKINSRLKITLQILELNEKYLRKKLKGRRQ